MNFKATSYKRKISFLIAGSAMALIIVYQFAIKKTIDLYQQNENLDRKFKKVFQLDQLETKLRTINNELNYYAIESKEKPNQLIESLSKLSVQYHVKLKTLPLEERTEYENFIVCANRITIEGNFHNLVQWLYAVEHANGIGKIVSVNFYSYKDNTNKKVGLLLTVFLQQVNL